MQTLTITIPDDVSAEQVARLLASIPGVTVQPADDNINTHLPPGMTEAQFIAWLEEGEEDVRNGRVYTWEEMKQKHGWV